MVEYNRTGNWIGWVITDEQAEAIANGDKQAVDKWYSDNLGRLFDMAYKWLIRRNYGGKNCVWVSTDDLVHQVYLDIPYLCWKNAKTLNTYIVQRSFRYCPFGGFCFMRENGWTFFPHQKDIMLDAPIYRHSRSGDKDSEFTLGSRISGGLDPYQELVEVDYDMTAQKLNEVVGVYLSKQEREFLSYRLDGVPPSFAVEHMGIKQWGGLTSRIKQKLQAHFAELKNELAKNGYFLSPLLKTEEAPKRRGRKKAV